MIALWRGELPLSRAFWAYAVLYGAVASAVATATAATAIIVDLPVALAVVLYLLPTPYYLIAAVGVWRSADAYAGPPCWGTAARIAVLIWTVVEVVV